ncbi:MAG TPA: hypothetical protein VKE88_01970 [Candidatus Nanoarchaeia archaeon]|nr:hypothetical protein [Candidatus Nanoarchaeia archaeon]
MPDIEGKSETWNVAGGYTQLKILKQLAEMDTYVRIAIYGYENIQEKFYYTPQQIVENRRESMRRLIDVIREIIENANFACKKEDRDKLDKMEQSVNYVDKYSDAIFIVKNDQVRRTQVIEINENHFWVCLNILRKVKKAIPRPLNNNGLIFPQTSEIDLSKIKDQLIHGG